MSAESAPTRARYEVTRDNLGFLLAKASQRWNDLLHRRFAAAGFPEVRPSYGSVLIPLYEEDGLRIGEVARRARLSKQTMTTLVRRVERDGLVERRPDDADGRAARIFLTGKAERFGPVAEEALGALDRSVAEALPGEARGGLDEALRLLSALEGQPARGDSDSVGMADGIAVTPWRRRSSPAPP